MITTRRGRLDEQKQQKKLVLAIGGMIAIIVFFALFGVKILIGFSVLVDNIRGSSPTPAAQSNKQVLFPPTLDPLPVATHSSVLRISGSGTAGLTATVYDNNKEVRKTTVAGNGVFTAQLPSLKDGKHDLTVKLSDTKGNTSEPSNPLTITIKTTKPELTIDSPENNATINSDSNMVSISGTTESDTTVSLNGRIAVIKPDNSFTYSYPLSDGENIIRIVATDMAGNTTTEELKLTYHK